MQIVVVVSQFCALAASQAAGHRAMVSPAAPLLAAVAQTRPSVQMLRKMMMQVMSSMDVSSSCQRLIASLIMASAALSAELFW